MRTNDLAGANAALEGALTLDPRSPLAHYYLALSRFQSKDYAGCVRELTAEARVQTRAPVSDAALYQLGA